MTFKISIYSVLFFCGLNVKAELQELIIYRNLNTKKLLFVCASFGTQTNVVRCLLCGVNLL